MAHVISLVTSKGGTGKTTTALNLAVALAEMGRRTILVDLDPQGSIGFSLARGDAEWTGLADHLTNGDSLDSVTIETKVPTLTLLARGRLDPNDVCAFESTLGAGETMKSTIDAVGEGRDYVILDNPSGLGAIARSSLSASDFALIPLQAEPLALRSFSQVLRVIDRVQQTENPDLKLLGILPTMVQLNEDTSLNVMGTVWSELGGVLDTCIPRAPIFASASELGLPVSFLAGRTPPEARRFGLLAGEIEALIETMTGEEGPVDETLHRQLI